MMIGSQHPAETDRHRAAVRWLPCVAMAAALSGCAEDDPFDAIWHIAAADANINATRSDGSPWDADGTAPDPAAVVTLNGVEIYRTDAIEDTLVPMWTNSSNGFRAERAKDLTIDVFDGRDTIIPSCAIEMNDELVEKTSATCTSDAGSVSLTVFVFSE
jgi:hypothetical protein